MYRAVILKTAAVVMAECLIIEWRIWLILSE
jgi:hypothetical protein